MSAFMCLAFFVDVALLRYTLTVVSVTRSVDLFLSYSVLSPPIVTLTLFISSFNGLIDATSLQCAIFFPFGICFR